MSTTKLYWEMSPKTYGDYLELLSDIYEAMTAGESHAVAELLERFQRLPGFRTDFNITDPHGPDVVPVVVGPPTTVAIRHSDKPN